MIAPVVFATLVCAACICAGIYVFRQVIRNMHWACESTEWPGTAGTLLETGVIPTDTGDSGGWKLAVRYSYQVGGATLEGTTIHPNYGGSSCKRQAAELGEFLTSGGSLLVRYDPAAPAASTLVVGHGPSDLLPLGFAITAVSWGVGFLMPVYGIPNSAPAFLLGIVGFLLMAGCFFEDLRNRITFIPAAGDIQPGSA